MYAIGSVFLVLFFFFRSFLTSSLVPLTSRWILFFSSGCFFCIRFAFIEPCRTNTFGKAGVRIHEAMGISDRKRGRRPIGRARSILENAGSKCRSAETKVTTRSRIGDRAGMKCSGPKSRKAADSRRSRLSSSNGHESMKQYLSKADK